MNMHNQKTKTHIPYKYYSDDRPLLPQLKKKRVYINPKKVGGIYSRKRSFLFVIISVLLYTSILTTAINPLSTFTTIKRATYTMVEGTMMAFDISANVTNRVANITWSDIMHFSDEGLNESLYASVNMAEKGISCFAEWLIRANNDCFNR
jgi:hypothetical protein